MNNKLTRREKVLLYVLLCFLVVMGGIYLLLLPSLTRYNTLKNDYESVKMAQAAAAAGSGGSALTLDEAKKKAEEAAAEFYTPMTTLELNDELTTMMLAYSLFPESLSVSEPEPGEPAAFGKETAKTTTGTTSDGSGSSTSASDSTSVLTSHVELRMSGDRQDMVRLLDHLADTPSFRVTSVYMKEGEAFSLAMDLYMFPAD